MADSSDNFFLTRVHLTPKADTGCAMSNFPDACHLDLIRSAMWKIGPYSGASVMVGAGFSKNGLPRSGANAQLPTWCDLSAGMLRQLYPDAADFNVRKNLAASTASLLSIAQEYEAAFGRTRLHEYVRSVIPDSEVEPGALHRLLV